MLKEGINKGFTNDEYHSNKTHVSSSGLKLFNDDPREYYRKYVEGVKEDHPNQGAMDFGTYIHTLILEPHLVDEEFAVFDGAMRRGDKWKQFEESNKSKIILTRTQGELAEKMIEGFESTIIRIGKHGYEKEVELASFFTDGKAEETFATTLDGIPVKVRCDYRKEFEDFGSVNDVKTTAEALYPFKDRHNLRICKEVCDRYSYDLSAALYIDVISAITGKEHDFYFTFLSKKTGHSCIFRASDAMIERGRAKYKSAIEGIKEAKETGIFFENKIMELG